MATAVCRAISGTLLFFRAAEGLGETFYFPASMSLISDYHGKRTRSRAMGTHQTSVYIGTIAGGFFGGLIGQYLRMAMVIRCVRRTWASCWVSCLRNCWWSPSAARRTWKISASASTMPNAACRWWISSK